MLRNLKKKRSSSRSPTLFQYEENDYDLSKLRKKLSQEQDTEFAPVKFTDRQSSIGNESRLYPRRSSSDIKNESKNKPTGRSVSATTHKSWSKLSDSGIGVQLEVEYKKPLQFAVKKTDDGELVEFKKIHKPNTDKQGITFNYESIVDFTVDVNKKHQFNERNSSFSSEEDESLYAEIEITVVGEYLFQVVSKKDGVSIPIRVFPKDNDTYRIQFQPLSTSGYVLQAKSAKKASLETSSEVTVGPLNCAFNNPKNLKVNDLIANDKVLSFTVNTRSAGPGVLNCYAYYSGGERAKLESKQLTAYTYSFRIIIKENKSGTLNLFLAHEST